MILLINLLGGPALISRLTLLIREKYGYAYNIEANYTAYSDIGFWSIYMGTDKKYLKKAVNLIYDELNFISDKKLTERDIEQAKEQLKGHIALSLDSNMELMFSLAKSIMMHGSVDSIHDIYRQLDAITMDELENIAKNRFSHANLGELIYSF